MGEEGIRFAIVENLRPGFKKVGAKNVRCLRIGSMDGAEFVPPGRTFVSRIEPGYDWTLGTVYVVSLSPEVRRRWPRQRASFYVVAKSDESIRAYLQERYDKIAARHMGLARWTISQLMQMTSTRPVSKPRVGGHAQSVGMKNVLVRHIDGGDTYEVSISDTLMYAVDALSGGRADIDLAMKKAANSMAGRMRNYMDRFFDPRVQTPFPEVAGMRRRRAS